MSSSVACAAGVSAPEEDGGAGGTNAGSSAGRAGQSGFSVAGKGGMPAVVASSGAGGTGSSGAPASGGQTSGASGGGVSGSNGSSGSSGAAGSGAAGMATGGAAAATCAAHAFAYAGTGQPLQSVHLSGTFNAWADPGLPLAYDASSQTWELSLELAAGSYAYKFVLDGKTWVADPNNPEQESDTFGGVNSLITVVCP